MVAPTLTLATPGQNASTSTTHTVTLPSGTADKVIFLLAQDAGSGHTASATGWTAQTFEIAQNRILHVLRRAATSETSVAVTTTLACYSVWVGGSTDGSISGVVFSTAVVGSGASADPGSVSVTSGDYRVVALGAATDGRRGISVWPTGYADNQTNERISSASRPNLAVASRGLTSITSEDPSAFSWSGNVGGNVGVTMAIPAAAASATTVSVAAAFSALTASATISEVGAVTVAASFQPLEAAATVAASAVLTVAGSFPELTASATVVAAAPGNLPTAAVIAIYDARTLSGSDTDPVASWPDLGPKSQAALAQATAGFRPTISDSDGIRWVLFDGVDDRLDVTLDQSYTGDFALILVLEPLTYPTADAAVAYSTGSVPDKNILGIDDVEAGWPNGAWVVMSGDGSQPEHHHGTALNLEAVATTTRFVMTQLVRDAGLLRLWENNNLVIDVSPASVGPLNNMGALKLGGRENNARFMNMRVGYLLLVDMAQATEVELLAARDDLVTQFAVTPTQTVTSTVQVPWDVHASLTDVVSVAWDVHASLTDVVSVAWDVHASLTDVVSVAWDVHASLTDVVSVAWDVHASLTDVVQVVWDTESISGVSASLQARWDVLFSVGDTLQALWGVLSQVIDQVQAPWNTRSAVTDSTNVSWTVNRIVLDEVQIGWAVETLNGVVRATQVQWDTLTLVSGGVSGSWDVLEALSPLVDFRWNLNERIVEPISFQWDVEGGAENTLDLSWKVNEELTDNVNFLWDVGLPVLDATSMLWDVRLTATDDTHLQWDVGGTVTASTSLLWGVVGVFGGLLNWIETRKLSNVQTNEANMAVTSTQGPSRIESVVEGEG